jgi:hypothetical protein
MINSDDEKKKQHRKINLGKATCPLSRKDTLTSFAPWFIHLSRGEVEG